MNFKTLLLIFVLCLNIPLLAHAGFVMNNANTIATNHNSTNAVLKQATTLTLKSLINSHPMDSRGQKGPLGKLSFVFGFCGLIPVIGALFSVAAIILGAMGLRKHQKHSLAGLILGIGTITLGVILTIVIFSSVSFI